MSQNQISLEQLQNSKVPLRENASQPTPLTSASQAPLLTNASEPTPLENASHAPVQNELPVQDGAPPLANAHLENLRTDLAITQKKGLPFIGASVVIWALILIATRLPLPLNTRNFVVFCCSCPLMPLAYFLGRVLKVDLFDKQNPLSKLGFIFTCNQLVYLLIVMWVFNAMPDKMVMVYAMVFGAHLMPYSWIYKSKSYLIVSIVLPIAALVIGCMFSASILAFVFVVFELVLVLTLTMELKVMK